MRQILGDPVAKYPEPREAGTAYELHDHGDQKCNALSAAQGKDAAQGGAKRCRKRIGGQHNRGVGQVPT